MIQQPTDLPVQMPEIKEGSGFFSSLKGLSLDDAISTIANGMVSFAFKLLIAIIVFYVGRFIIIKLYKLTHKVMVSRKIDPSLTTFVLSLVKMVLYFILIVTVIGILGIETSSFLAIFASAGVAIGMALSGTLQNFAGGVLILLIKPYKVGDYIEAQGYAGTVKAIQIFHTVINTIDNKAIIIPNGALSTSSINNYSLEEYRRVDWTIALAYGTDFDKAKAKIIDMLASEKMVVHTTIENDENYRARKLAEAAAKDSPETEAALSEEVKTHWWQKVFHRSKKHQEILKQKLTPGQMEVALGDEKLDRSPQVFLSELADSSVNISVRVWTYSPNYWPLYFKMNQRFYKELPESGFEFPFPQMDVHFDSAQPLVVSQSK